MIMGLFFFARRAKAGSSQCATRAVELGRSLVAMRVAGEFRAPPGSVEVVFSAAGQARRVPAGRAGAGERAYCFHPGPYTVEFAPYEGAPELGLQLRFVIDAADPRVAQQRFDLYLCSEVEDALPVAEAGAAIERAVREALGQGTLDLPPCTTLQEWNAFRAGLNQLLYTRFGVTVDDCIPIDLGDRVDYAAMLRARAAAMAAAEHAAVELAPAVVELARAAPADARTIPTAAVTDISGDAAPSVQPPAEQARRAKAAPDALSAIEPPGAAPIAAGSPVMEPPGEGGTAAVPPSAGPFVAAPAASRQGAARAPSPERPAAARAAASPSAGRPNALGAQPVPPCLKTPEPKDTASADARALRRLFLELPYLAGGLRLLPLPPGQPLFVARRNLLQRVAVIALDVNTMPSLAWAAPDQPLAKDQQARRARHSLLAAQALDQAWALLARMQLAAAMQCREGEMGALLDDADRLVSNLDFHLAQRRAAHAAAAESRLEPTL